MNIDNVIAPFQYMGGKYSVLPWLLPLLPESYSFVDVFGGSGVVLLNRRPSPLETYNDINENVVNFFRVLRSRQIELVTALELTPHSRYEYNHAWDNNGDDEVERARKFFVRIRQSFMSAGGQKEKKGWSATSKNSRINMSEATSKWLGSIDGLAMVAERLRCVQIEQRHYKHILANYDSPEALLYLDPPYDDEHRSEGKTYAHDFTENDHRELSEIAQQCKGNLAISGYDSKLMRELYADWIFHKGPERRNNYSKKEGIHECLWTNYDPFKQQLKLFPNL